MSNALPSVKAHLVLGTAQFDRSYGIVRHEDSGFNACGILAKAEKLGIDAVDTAPAYSNAQERIRICRWGGAVHTKIPSNFKAHISLTKSLKILGRNYVDVAYFHDPSVLAKNASFFKRIHSIVTPTLTKSLGVSVYTSKEFDAALANPFISVIQAPISLVDARISDEQLIQGAVNGKRIYARSIFLQGSLLQNPNSLPRFLSKLKPVLESLRVTSVDMGIPLMDILLKSVILRPGIAGLVVGAESPNQLQQIWNAFNGPPMPSELKTVLRSLTINDINVIDPRRWPST